LGLGRTDSVNAVTQGWLDTVEEAEAPAKNAGGQATKNDGLSYEGFRKG